MRASEHTVIHSKSSLIFFGIQNTRIHVKLWIWTWIWIWTDRNAKWCRGPPKNRLWPTSGRWPTCCEPHA